jgi:hypothetical protein
MRLRIALALLAVVLLVSACSVTKGYGQVVTETREWQPPRSSSAGAELTIEKTDRIASISAEDNLLPADDDVSGDT